MRCTVVFDGGVVLVSYSSRRDMLSEPILIDVRLLFFFAKKWEGVEDMTNDITQDITLERGLTFFLDSLFGKNRSKATIRAYQADISQFIRFLHENSVLSKNVVLPLGKSFNQLLEGQPDGRVFLCHAKQNSKQTRILERVGELL